MMSDDRIMTRINEKKKQNKYSKENQNMLGECEQQIAYLV